MNPLQVPILLSRPFQGGSHEELPDIDAATPAELRHIGNESLTDGDGTQSATWPECAARDPSVDQGLKPQLARTESTTLGLLPVTPVALAVLGFMLRMLASIGSQRSADIDLVGGESAHRISSGVSLVAAVRLNDFALAHTFFYERGRIG